MAFGPRIGAPFDDAFLDPESLTLSLQRNDSLEVHGSIWFHFGRRFLEDTKSWKPIEEPTIGGFEVMYEFVKEFPLQVEFGFQYAKKEDEDTTAGVREQYESFEIYLGLRQSWDINFFATHMYVGGGLSLNWMDAELQNGTGGAQGYEDQVIGAYLHTGAFVPLGTYLVMGIDLRGMLASNYQLGPNSMGSNYVQATIFAGFSW